MIGSIFSDQELTLNASIDLSVNLTGTVVQNANLHGSIYLTTGYDNYNGDYIFTPKVAKQIVKTDDRLMTDNITIQPIPYYEVSNNYGGQTITIGGDQ